MDEYGIDILAAAESIARDFDNEGEYDFMAEAELKELVKKLVTVDLAYMDEIGDDVYDEDIVYERLYAAAEEQCPQYKTYLMRFVEDYMDFMEQYLVSVGAVEWE